MANLAGKTKDTDLAHLVDAEGVELRRSGRYYTGICPFHEDKHPSFTVKDNRFRCYGCGAHGNAIDFVRALKGLSFREALAYLGVETDKSISYRDRKKARIEANKRKHRSELVGTFRAWEATYSTALGRRIRGAYAWISKNIHEPSDLEGETGDMLAGLYKELPLWEWGLEVLACGSDEEKYRLFEATNGKICPGNSTRTNGQR